MEASVDHIESHTVTSRTSCGWVKSTCFEVRLVGASVLAVRQNVVLRQGTGHHWTSKSPLLNEDRDRPSTCRVHFASMSREPLGFLVKSLHLSNPNPNPVTPSVCDLGECHQNRRAKNPPEVGVGASWSEPRLKRPP